MTPTPAAPPARAAAPQAPGTSWYGANGRCPAYAVGQAITSSPVDSNTWRERGIWIASVTSATRDSPAVLQLLGGHDRVLTGRHRLDIDPADLEVVLLDQHVAHQGGFGESTGFGPAARDQDRQARLARETRAIAQALQRVGLDRLAAPLGRATIVASRKNDDGLCPLQLAGRHWWRFERARQRVGHNRQ